MNLSDVLDQLELPQTRVADTAWDDARRRVVRRRGAAAGGVAVLAVAATVAVIVGAGLGRDAVPSPAPAPSSPSPTRTVEPRDAPVVQRLVIGGAWRSLVRDFPSDRLAGFAHPPSLADDPVSHAALVMAKPGEDTVALVLGEDLRWREIREPQLLPVRHSAGYFSPVVRPGSLSPDATQLAIPQPDSLVVVDLTDGSHHSYAVPGEYNTFVAWADADHVLVVQGGAQHGVLVDLHDGTFKHTAYGPSTAFTGGTTITWEPGGPTHSTLVWGDGRRVRTLGDTGAQFFPQPPLVKNDVVVGVGGLYSDDTDPTFGTIGISVVDGSSGKVLAYLPFTRSDGTPALLLGWEGDDPVIALPMPQSSGYLYVFSWDWRRGELDPVARVGWWTSWGTGQVTQ